MMTTASSVHRTKNLLEKDKQQQMEVLMKVNKQSLFFCVVTLHNNSFG